MITVLRLSLPHLMLKQWRLALHNWTVKVWISSLPAQVLLLLLSPHLDDAAWILLLEFIFDEPHVSPDILHSVLELVQRGLENFDGTFWRYHLIWKAEEEKILSEAIQPENYPNIVVLVSMQILKSFTILISTILEATIFYSPAPVSVEDNRFFPGTNCPIDLIQQPIVHHLV